MLKTYIAILAAVVCWTPAAASDSFKGYPLEESNRFHQQWNMDNWDEGGPLMRYVFLNMPEFWNHEIIDRGGPIRELPSNPRRDVASFEARTEDGPINLTDYVARSTVDGALVVHRGQIVFESYPRMLQTDKHNYMSISKGIVATAVAILADRGLIDSDETIDKYIAELRGTAWDGITIIDILDMASGMWCLEQTEGSYSDPDHCYYQFEASLGWIRPTSETPDNPYGYVAGMPSHRPAGEAFEYTSQDTFVLGWLIEEISGMQFAEFVSREIWQRMGAEADAVIAAPRNGVPIVHGGISSTLRDVARFGLLFVPSGRQDNNPVITDAYLNNIRNGGRPEIFNAGRETPRLIDDEAPRHNTWQWDFVMEDGDFFKGGYGGQGLYISPSRDLVIAFFGTFEEDGTSHEMTRIARQLAKSGLFD